MKQNKSIFFDTHVTIPFYVIVSKNVMKSNKTSCFDNTG